jgi:hypothetical protein
MSVMSRDDRKPYDGKGAHATAVIARRTDRLSRWQSLGQYGPMMATVGAVSTHRPRRPRNRKDFRYGDSAKSSRVEERRGAASAVRLLSPLIKPDVRVFRIKCGSPHLMRNVAPVAMWR